MSDLLRLASDLGRAPAKVFPIIQKGLDATLHDIKESAKSDAPSWSGRYARSITYTRTGFKGEVGPESRYGHLVEDGGARSSPNPVMARATKKHERGLDKAMDVALGRALW